MKENPLVSIVILNFNSGNLLSNCVDSIKNSKYSNYEIIVVDNASEDESISLCKQKFSDIKFIENCHHPLFRRCLLQSHADHFMEQG